MEKKLNKKNGCESRIDTFIMERLPGMVEERLTGLPVKGIYARKVLKNNGVRYRGIYVELEQADMTPCIYADPYLPADISGLQDEEDWNSIADRMARDICFALSRADSGIVKEIGPGGIPDHLELELINKKKNAELLKKVPHRDFLDLAIILVWTVSVDGRRGVIKVNDEVMSLLGSNFDELFEAAFENVRRRYSVKIAPVDDVVEDLSGIRPMPVDSGLYLMTLEGRTGGGIAMLYPEMTRELYERIGEPYYLIPSSIHEVLAVSRSIEMEWRDVRNMICEVNREVLSPEDVLSDSLYIYDPEKGKISLMTEKKEAEYQG